MMIPESTSPFFNPQELSNESLSYYKQEITTFQKELSKIRTNPALANPDVIRVSSKLAEDFCRMQKLIQRIESNHSEVLTAKNGDSSEARKIANTVFRRFYQAYQGLKECYEIFRVDLD